MTPTSTRTVLQAVRALRAWRAVRPEATHFGVPPTTLIQAGYAGYLPTALGRVVILSAKGHQLIGCHPHIVSERSAQDSVYVQDAQNALHAAGFRNLTPGRWPYFAVTGRNGRSNPLLGRCAGHGYTKARIKWHAEQLEADLLARGAYLILIHPLPEPPVVHSRLTPIYAPPRWPTGP